MQTMSFTAKVPNSAFGIESQKHTPAFSPESFGPAKAWIPDVDPRHVFPTKEFIQFRTWWMVGENEPITLAGPQGAGKSSFAKQWAARVNVPVFSYTCQRHSEKMDLIGSMLPFSDGLRWVDGPVTKAWRYGGIVLINEISIAQDFGASLNDLTEGAPIEIPQTNEIIKRHPNARMVITDNIRGLVGDESGMLQGRNLQDASAKDRDHQLFIDYMPAHDEIKLFKSYMPVMGPDAAASEQNQQQLAETLRKFCEDVRASYIGANPSSPHQLECTLSTRTALRWLKLSMAYRDFDAKLGFRPMIDALDQALTSKVSDQSRIAMHSMLELHFGKV